MGKRRRRPTLVIGKQVEDTLRATVANASNKNHFSPCVSLSYCLLSSSVGRIYYQEEVRAVDSYTKLLIRFGESLARKREESFLNLPWGMSTVSIELNREARKYYSNDKSRYSWWPNSKERFMRRSLDKWDQVYPLECLKCRKKENISSLASSTEIISIG